MDGWMDGRREGMGGWMDDVRHDLFLTGPNCGNAGAPSQQEIKAARVRLGSTHSYRRIRPASESAAWPISWEALEGSHSVKRGAFSGWQKLFAPTCPFQAGAKSFLPSSPCCDCQHYALHTTQPCESCSRPARGFVYKKGLHHCFRATVMGPLSSFAARKVLAARDARLRGS